MGVYERKYKRYTGALTPTSTRFLVLPKYAFKDVFKNRWMLAFYVSCFAFPLYCAAVIYLANNAGFLSMFPNFKLSDIIEINGSFFYMFLKVQGWFAFLLSLFVGPGLVSRDLANNGLGLYFSRPFSRVEYVLGKVTVLAALLSSITWMVGMLLMFMHANFTSLGWLVDNARWVLTMLIGPWIWIVTLSLMSLAVSAWVRWRPVAAFTMLAVLFGGAFFSQVINALFRTEIGTLLNLLSTTTIVWAGMLGVDSGSDISPYTAAFVIVLFWGVLLLMLNRRIRAYEVVS